MYALNYFTGILLIVDFCLVYCLPEQFDKKISLANKFLISIDYSLSNSGTLLRL